MPVTATRLVSHQRRARAGTERGGGATSSTRRANRVRPSAAGRGRRPLSGGVRTRGRGVDARPGALRPGRRCRRGGGKGRPRAAARDRIRRSGGDRRSSATCGRCPATTATSTPSCSGTASTAPTRARWRAASGARTRRRCWRWPSTTPTSVTTPIPRWPKRRQRATRRNAEAELLAALPAVRRPAARLLLALARAVIPQREIGKANYTRCLDGARLAARSLGRAMAGSGDLSDPEDVFHLTVAELLADHDPAELRGPRRRTPPARGPLPDARPARSLDRSARAGSRRGIDHRRRRPADRSGRRRRRGHRSRPGRPRSRRGGLRARRGPGLPRPPTPAGWRCSTSPAGSWSTWAAR